MLVKLTTDVTYRVPAWNYCNLVKPGTLNKPTKDMCRFCCKDGKGFRCALYNKTLDVQDTVLAKKTCECQKATAHRGSKVEDEQSISVDPKKLMKSTIQLYNKTRNQLLKQGYPASIADKLAQEYVLED